MVMGDSSIVEKYQIFESLIALHSDIYTFAISDTDKFLYVRDEIGIGVTQDDKVKDGSVTHQALMTRRPTRHFISKDKSAYGDTEYVAMSTPIFDNEELVGAIVWCVTTNEMKLVQTASELLALSEELTASAHNFSENSTSLAQSNERLFERVGILESHMSEIEQMGEVVTALATESHILGINAAIEAAHSGEYGAGFGVVAVEIRRLAEQSKGSAKQIEKTVHDTENAFQEIAEYINNVSGAAEEQAAGSEELLTAIEQIRSLAVRLNELSESAKSEELSGELVHS